MDGNRRFFRDIRSERHDRRDVPGDTGETEKSTARPQEKRGFHEIIWNELFPQAFSIGISLEEFKHLTPIKLRGCFEGFKLLRERRDNEAWLWFGTYGISAFSFAIDHCLNGSKAKTEYMKNPLLSKENNDEDMSEDELQKQREAFVMKMRTMQANFHISHPKEDTDGD